MVLAALLGRDTVTVKRLVTSEGDGAWDHERTYTTAARGSLPTTWKCRAQHMTSREQIEYGVKGNANGWKFLGHTRPQIDERDQIVFSDSEGTEHTIKVLGKERNGDNQGIVWQVNGEEVSTET